MSPRSRPGEAVLIGVQAIWTLDAVPLPQTAGVRALLVGYLPSSYWAHQPAIVARHEYYRLEEKWLAILLGPFGMGLALPEWYKVLP